MFVLALAYPLLVHLAVLWPKPWLEWLALAVLCALVLYRGLRSGRIWAWGAFTAALAASALLVFLRGAHWLMLLPPVAIPLSLFFVFSSSLHHGRVALVTRMATLMRGPLPPDLERYTRAVTVLWTAVFVGLTLSAIALSLFASRELWSLATNFIHYLIIGAVFVGEYAYRRWRFRHHSHPSFWAYVRGLAPVRSRSP
jgi:uncharacterized membrane protein